MNDDWKKSFQKKMEDYESPVPDDLWDDVMTGIDAHRKKRLHVRRLSFTIGSLVAAAASVILLLKILPAQDTDDTNTNAKHLVESVVSSQPNADKGVVSSKTNTAYRLLAVNDKPRNDDNSAITEIITPDEISESPQGNDSPGTEKTVKETTAGKSTEGRKGKTPVKKQHSDYYDNYYNDNFPATDNRRRRRKASFGLTLQNSLVGSMQSGNGGMMASADMQDNKDYAFLYASNAVSLQENKLTTTAHHHTPIRLGFTFAIPLSERWSVETGIIYSYNSSDIERSVGNNVTEGTQHLHYVGIPLNVLYKVWGNKKLNVYASGGTKAEKMVYGQQKIDGESHKVSINPLQWSLNAHGGIEYKLSDHVGVYAEPGIGYYIDNNSNIPTIYKDKPWNPELRLGIRISK